MDENRALQVVDFTDYALTPERIRRQVNLIQEVMKEVMRDGEHYGKIPGCGDKPSLLKPGAEKISTSFALAPSYDIKRTDLQNGHREYEIICTLTHIPTGKVAAQGVGACSTMEGKFRYRWDSTGKPVPKEYWENRDPAVLGGSAFVARKKDGKWVIFQRVEHDNPADYYNTVLKMAKKRAHVDAVLTATAASDIFTQDIEDMPEVLDPEKAEEEEETPKEKMPAKSSGKTKGS